MRRQTAAVPLAAALAIVSILCASRYQHVRAASAPQFPQFTQPAEQWERAVAFWRQQSPTASFPKFVEGHCTPSAELRGNTAVLDYCNAFHAGAPASADDLTQHANASVTFHAARAPTDMSPTGTNEVVPAAFEECSYFVYRWHTSGNIAHTLMEFVDAFGLLRWLRTAHGRAGHMEVVPGKVVHPYDADMMRIFNASFGESHPPDACFITRTQTSLNHLSSPSLEHSNYVRTAVRDACGAPSDADKVVLVHRAGEGARARNFINGGKVLAAMMAVFPVVEVRRSSSGGLCEQCLLYADARIVVSPHGQQLTNLWCMKQGTVLIELFPWLFFHPLYQFFGSSMGLHTFGSFGEPLVHPEGMNPFLAASRNGFDIVRCGSDPGCQTRFRTQLIAANITHLLHVLAIASRIVPAAEQVA